MIFDDDQIEPGDVADEESGEDAVSGTTPSLESDDDVGQMVKDYTGVDPDPNMDNPQEVNTAKEVDDAEEDIRES